MPSAVMPYWDWNFLTAFSVLSSYVPVMSPVYTPSAASSFWSFLTSLPWAPFHMVLEPKCSVLSTRNVCLRVTTLPPLSEAVTVMVCLPWARPLRSMRPRDAGPE